MSDPRAAPAARVSNTADEVTATAPPRDWPAQVADTIESVVGGIANKTTVPATTAVRAIVYGVVIAAMATVALVLVAVASDRLLVIAYDEIGAGVWAAHATLGAIFVGAGMLLWRMRRPRNKNRS